MPTPPQLPRRSQLLFMFHPYSRYMYPHLLSHPPHHIAPASENKADVMVEDVVAAGDVVMHAPHLLTIYVTCNRRGYHRGAFPRRW